MDNNWISVKEDLPKRESFYLVFANNNIHMMYYGEYSTARNGWFNNGLEIQPHMKPTHWMPLPPSPHRQ